MIELGAYVRFLREEYLDDFVAQGGAAVKFAVPGSGHDQRRRFSAALAEAALADGYLHARVDAAETRAHMIDQVFFAVARQIPWDETAATFLRGALEASALGVPAEQADLSLPALARHLDYDEGELNRTLNRYLQRELLKDYELAQEFRIAMVRLCQAQLRGDEVDQGEHEAVLSWIVGELRHVSRLRSATIFSKIARHNARSMLLSTARWLTRTGYRGLSLELDISRLARARRDAADPLLHYSKPAVLDAYEVLRQLVDGTDELRAVSVVVTAAPEFLTDERRGLDAYSALKLRLWDEVHDRDRDNPLSSLVRLEVAGG